jgi:hypothetical protein
MANSTADSITEHVWMKKSCTKQVAAPTFLWPRRKTAAMEGSVETARPRSATESMERKRYMGVCRWGSELTARMMSRFPNTVIRYMERKSPNMRGCISGSSENPRSKNSEILVLFLASICWL